MSNFLTTILYNILGIVWAILCYPWLYPAIPGYFELFWAISGYLALFSETLGLGLEFQDFGCQDQI